MRSAPPCASRKHKRDVSIVSRRRVLVSNKLRIHGLYARMCGRCLWRIHVSSADMFTQGPHGSRRTRAKACEICSFQSVSVHAPQTQTCVGYAAYAELGEPQKCSWQRAIFRNKCLPIHVFVNINDLGKHSLMLVLMWSL